MKELFRNLFEKKVWANFAVYVRNESTMSYDFVGYESVYIWSDEVKKWSHDYTDTDPDGVTRYHEFHGIVTR